MFVLKKLKIFFELLKNIFDDHLNRHANNYNYLCLFANAVLFLFYFIFF